MMETNRVRYAARLRTERLTRGLVQSRDLDQLRIQRSQANEKNVGLHA